MADNPNNLYQGVTEMELFFQQAPCGFLYSLPNGLIIRCNPTFIDMLGYSEEELLRLHWQDLLSIGGKMFYETHYAPLLNMQGFIKEVNFDFLKRDGSKLPVFVNAKLTNDVNNIPIMLIIVCEMHQRKQYEKELLLAKKKAEELVELLSSKNKELDTFAYVISHDLKAPLNNIIGLLSIMDENHLAQQLNEEERLILNHVENNVQKLVLFIDALLAYYKKTHNIQIQKEAINFTAFINDLNHLLNAQAKYNINYPLDNKVICIDKIALEQIFINLISNGIKYNDSETIQINIGLKEQDNHYIFTIEDNGIGMSDKEQLKAFKLFSNLGKKDREGNYGTGIGLATIQKIIESQKGSIHIESEPGKGTRFSITIPK